MAIIIFVSAQESRQLTGAADQPAQEGLEQFPSTKLGKPVHEYPVLIRTCN
jgi:hypothetical protein